MTALLRVGREDTVLVTTRPMYTHDRSRLKSCEIKGVDSALGNRACQPRLGHAKRGEHILFPICSAALCRQLFACARR